VETSRLSLKGAPFIDMVSCPICGVLVLVPPYVKRDENGLCLCRLDPETDRGVLLMIVKTIMTEC
jgi:hypothetical protein